MAQKSAPHHAGHATGASLRALHERVKQREKRDQAAGKQQNKLTQPQNRWQRKVRYVWDRKKG